MSYGTDFNLKVDVVSLPSLPAGSAGLGSVNVTGTTAVSGTFWQATQPVSIAGSVAVTGAFFPATQPVSIAGTVPISTSAPLAVTSTNDATLTKPHSNTTGDLIKTSPGRLVSVLVTTLGTATCLIYDNASTTSGTVIGVVPGNTPVGTVLVFAAPAANGIAVGGVANNCLFTVMYA